MNNINAIQTPVGLVTGRDGFYLDNVSEDKQGHRLVFSGDINLKLASEYKGQATWMKYKLEFSDVTSFKKEEVENSSFGEDSSFVELPPSDTKRQFIFATYDYVYEIEARDYVFSLGEERT